MKTKLFETLCAACGNRVVIKEVKRDTFCRVCFTVFSVHICRNNARIWHFVLSSLSTVFVFFVVALSLSPLPCTSFASLFIVICECPSACYLRTFRYIVCRSFPQLQQQFKENKYVFEFKSSAYLPNFFLSTPNSLIFVCTFCCVSSSFRVYFACVSSVCTCTFGCILVAAHICRYLSAEFALRHGREQSRGWLAFFS